MYHTVQFAGNGRLGPTGTFSDMTSKFKQLRLKTREWETSEVWGQGGLAAEIARHNDDHA